MTTRAQIAREYTEAFGDDPRRATRLRVLAGVLDLDLPISVVDGWAERRQNPDRAPGVGPVVIAFYLNMQWNPSVVAKGGGGIPALAGAALYEFRSHPMFREEAEGTVRPNYRMIYMNVPATVSGNILQALALSAVDQVNPDKRWTEALS